MLQRNNPKVLPVTVDDAYRELGLDPGSSAAEVKAAWRRLAARWHPDRNASPQALRKIQRINRALEAIRQSAADAPPEADASQEDTGADPVVEHTLHLTLEEVAAGCSRELHGSVVEDCADCDGSGLQPHATVCGECGGSGQLRQPLWVAWMSPLVTCGACQGRGTTRQGCPACAATGRMARDYSCRVQVPPGARAGDVLDVDARMQGRRRKHPLALRVRVALQAHELFAAETDGTVRCELPVDGFAWIANRWVDVPTPRGPQQMKLQRGHLAYRIKGAGLPWGAAGASADCLVTIAPLFPAAFSREQEAAIDRLVAGNTGAAGTPAGERMDEWNARVQRWQARCEPGAG
jgi:DnaJ-class molecular chaperone